MFRSMWVCDSEHRESPCLCGIWRRNMSGCLCMCLLGQNVRVCVRARIPSHAHNRHVSCVRVRASVSQALISLCLHVISPELAALKHQRETSAVRIYRLVCKCVCVCVRPYGVCVPEHVLVCACVGAPGACPRLIAHRQ